MKQFEESNEFDHQFASIKRKMTLTDIEKNDVLQQINKKINSPLKSEKSKSIHSRYTYYVALSTALLLLTILISPGFIDFSQKTGMSFIEIEKITIPQFSVALIGPLFVIALFSFVVFICFYYAFKPKQDDDDSFLDLFGYETVVAFIFIVIFSILKKIMPKKWYIVTFRLLMFTIGFSLVYFIFIFWNGLV